MSTDAIDTSAHIETPEHIAFEFRLAGPWRRGLAYIIDFIVRAILLTVIITGISFATSAFEAFGDLKGAEQGLMLLLYFGIEWFYYVLLEWLWDGRTIGKKALGLRVVKEGGYPIGVQDSFLRNLLRAADLMPPLLPLGLPLPTYLVGVLACSADPHFRRLGDLVAGTMVIVDEPVRLRAPAPVEPPPTSQEMSTIPAHPRMAMEERKTLDAFLRRFGTLHKERREEICIEYAKLLAKRFGSPPPRSGARYLQLVYARLSETATPRRRGAG